MDLCEFEKKIYSQNGEDGITVKLLEMLYDGDRCNKYYVEFGVESGFECNTRILRDLYGWNGLQMDGTYQNLARNHRKEFITKENIVSLFQKYYVPQRINLLSVDIDFNDFYCLKEILTKYESDIIICEYNGTHLADEDKIIVYDATGMWDGSNYFGASLLALHNLVKKYNYSLVYCDITGTNCFFVNNRIIAERHLTFLNLDDTQKLYKPAAYGTGPNRGHPQDMKYRPYVTCEEALKL